MGQAGEMLKALARRQQEQQQPLTSQLAAQSQLQSMESAIYSGSQGWTNNGQYPSMAAIGTGQADASYNGQHMAAAQQQAVQRLSANSVAPTYPGQVPGSVSMAGTYITGHGNESYVKQHSPNQIIYGVSAPSSTPDQMNSQAAVQRMMAYSQQQHQQQQLADQRPSPNMNYASYY